MSLLRDARDENARAQLEEEADRVLAGRPARQAAQAKLPIANRTITETIRMRPAAWMTTRTVSTRVTVAGHVLEPGTTLVSSPYTIHRRPDLFDPPAVQDRHSGPGACTCACTHAQSHPTPRDHESSDRAPCRWPRYQFLGDLREYDSRVLHHVHQSAIRAAPMRIGAPSRTPNRETCIWLCG
ncbi:cytochrome P450 [Streptomyces lydicus]|uniref:cytochrome P450 n=1 Tax=Streptomyces lydicus TaxID=47763 RepID=UPI0037A8F4C7